MNEITLADILEGYVVETPAGNDQNILRKWMENYPQFAADLMDFAAARAVVKFAPEEEFSAQDEKRYQEFGLNNLRLFLSKTNNSQAVPESLTDLAKEKGLNKAKFAATLGVSLSLLMYLEKKRLEFSSIPQAVIKKISDVLETGEELVSAYLKQLPDLAGEASFKTTTRPEEVKLKSFPEAVREDQMLSAEGKKKLLELK